MSEYLSKERVATEMRQLADNIKNTDLALEVQDLASRIEESGDEE